MPFIAHIASQPFPQRSLITELKPSIIVHAAAERRPDVCEGDDDATKSLNGTLWEPDFAVCVKLTYTANPLPQWMLLPQLDSVPPRSTPGLCIFQQTM